MKICVLGAGVIGVSTAFALARLGHNVSVIDKAPDVAMGASYANGAQLSYSYIDPLASPATLRKLPSYLFGRDKALQLKFALKIDYLNWGLSFLRNCAAGHYEANRLARHNLSELSCAALASFEGDVPKGFQPTGKGKLVLAQNPSDYASMKHVEGFVTPERCLGIEPSLRSWRKPILGGVYSSTDVALNTVTYCKALKSLAEQTFGTCYNFGETVHNIVQKNGIVKGVQTDQRFHQADKVIVCLGNEALSILKPFGVKLPIYPVQGYSLTLRSNSSSPRVSITDLKHKIVYANLGESFRIAGFVDVNQRPENIDTRTDLLLKIARDSWPDAADFGGPIERWTGARPMMPSGVPVIKESQIEGLYLNLGHGSLGYTFAAGSAMKIANLIGHAQKNTSIIQGVRYAV